MSWNSNDYNGITNASEERDYYDLAAAREDARDAARAAENARQYADNAWMRSAPLLAGVRTRKAA